MKKLLSIFIVFCIVFTQIISYFYDSFFVSYDIIKTNLNNNLSVNIANKNISNLNYQELYSHNSDNSITKITIKWLKITQSKLNFITNNKGLFTFNSKNNSNKNLLTNNNSSKNPVKYYITSLVNNLKSKNDKILTNNKIEFLLLSFFEIEEKFIEKFFFKKEFLTMFDSQAPPYIISLTKV